MIDRGSLHMLDPYYPTNEENRQIVRGDLQYTCELIRMCALEIAAWEIIRYNPDMYPNRQFRRASGDYVYNAMTYQFGIAMAFTLETTVYPSFWQECCVYYNELLNRIGYGHYIEPGEMHVDVGISLAIQRKLVDSYWAISNYIESFGWMWDYDWCALSCQVACQKVCELACQNCHGGTCHNQHCGGMAG